MIQVEGLTKDYGLRRAIDNLTFDVIPEPASLILFGLGAIALLKKPKTSK